MSRPAIRRVLPRLVWDRDNCWVWPGALSINGYGIAHNAAGSRYVHRITFEHFIGPVPEGHDLDHLCRNRVCANPHHLEPVSRQENVNRGNGSKRERCGRGHEPDWKWRFTRGKYWQRDCMECSRENARKQYQRLKEARAHADRL